MDPAGGGLAATIDGVITQAWEHLPGRAWDYLVGGAESEVTLRRNRDAFDRIAFRPRMLAGDAGDDALATRWLGVDIDLPVLLAPVGSIGAYSPDGARSAARAAERAGTALYFSSIGTPSLAEVVGAGSAPTIVQIYVDGDRGWIRDRLDEAAELGCHAVCFTEFPTIARRERLPQSFYGEGDGRMSFAEAAASLRHQAALRFEDIAWAASASRLPVIVKGVMTGADAVRAIDNGAAAVHVSNHGGRQLDHMQSTIEVLPEIVDAVAGRVDVVVDSGFVRGSDVVKALALGADAVAVGKLMCWGLSAGGEAGLTRVLDLLRDEIAGVLAHLGVATVRDLTPEHVVEAAPPSASAWIGFAGRRDDASA